MEDARADASVDVRSGRCDGDSPGSFGVRSVAVGGRAIAGTVLGIAVLAATAGLWWGIWESTSDGAIGGAVEGLPTRDESVHGSQPAAESPGAAEAITTVTFRDVASGGNDARAEIRIHVTDALGRAVSDAALALSADGQPLGAGENPRELVETRTDSGGSASIEPRGSIPGVLAVAAPGHAPHELRLEALAATHLVVLPGPRSLSGRVVLNGRPPSQPFQFEVRVLAERRSLRASSMEGFFNGRGFMEGRIPVRTDGTGAFELWGVPAGRLAEFVFPDRWRPCGGGNDSPPKVLAPARTPASDLLLELQSFPVIRGRPAVARGAGGMPEQVEIRFALL